MNAVPWLLALSLLVTVPLGLRRHAVAWRWWHGVALSAAAASLALPRGDVAGVLAGGWLLGAALILFGARRSPWTTLMSLAWLPAAAAWLVADRVGLRPLGFGVDTVELTAAHFHQAGFGVSTLLVQVRARRTFVIHQAGMIVVAAGITMSNRLQPIGAALIVVALTGYSVGALRAAQRTAGWRRGCLRISAVAWAYPMLLAMSWALAPFGHGIVVRTLDAMVAQHAAVNAIALVLVGLVGFTADRHTTHLHTSPRTTKEHHALAPHPI